ncbi:hypothetical protein ACFFX1_55015 [Dactylosporangium sucinum]|uniref:hypothetical protein n=1 Tax=Dactylosporangium sucinum TaxID=1424081 RepID=UPI00167C63F0|nr:hypothetical protein [Dactylosporangium sucinum]
MLNVIYALLTEHGSAEQVEEINNTLDAPMAGADGFNPERERELLAAVDATFSASLND